MRTKFLALLLCVAVLNLTQFSTATAVEAKDDGGYNVVYDGGSIPGLKAGMKLRMYIDSNQIRIMKKKRSLQLSCLPPSRILATVKMFTDVLVQQSASRLFPSGLAD